MSNTKSLYLSVAPILELLAACVDSATESKDQPLVVLECEEGFAPTTLVGARQLAEGDCIDTEEALVLELCAVYKSVGEPYLSCVQTDAGERYWVRGHDTELGETPGFTFCSEVGEVSPAPCFVGNCGLQEYPFSNCSEEQTKAVLRCGKPDAPWDENCCRRDYCLDGACGPGFTCAQVAAEELFVLPYATAGMDGSIACESWSTWQYNPFSVCVAQ